MSLVFLNMLTTLCLWRPLLLLFVKCQQYAKTADEFCRYFNATKSKCSVILPIFSRLLAREFQSCIFYVAKKPIENVEPFLHLGHLFTSEFNDDEDIVNGRSNFFVT